MWIDTFFCVCLGRGIIVKLKGALKQKKGRGGGLFSFDKLLLLCPFFFYIYPFLSCVKQFFFFFFF
ncbi:hypothetical protein CROQUDRAFT_479940 [Cronartium quercuum f. sp. fusiforme G11]|uniref:Uncharacterized protein n=1 Tax=Cronartium quercuum f. sp. fusiforme G11 TaxID=708437 RepID=A0A9P6NKF8_9BASI|nr:hypothetical protein CROQUDRAFT_479940 [Cronartium quercuum f. sp. fusiforme G11]